MNVLLCMPVYNESSGIRAYVRELFGEFGRDELKIVAVNDCSTDQTLSELIELKKDFESRLVVLTNPTNLGHGPSLLEAMRFAVASREFDFDHLVTVDGDGQIPAAEVRKIVSTAKKDGAPVAEGQRVKTTDKREFTRLLLSALSRLFVQIWTGRDCADANTPGRVYERKTITLWLEALGGRNLLMPNIYFSIVARHRADPVVVKIRWRDRLGPTSVGSTWPSRRISRYVRLLQFSVRGLLQLSPLLIRQRFGAELF